MSQYPQRAGKKYESDLMKYLRESGFDAERLRLTGAEDEGDLLLRNGARRYVIEAKRTKGFNLAGWVKEAEVESYNYANHRGLGYPYFLVVHYARGQGLGRSYVTTTLDEFLTILEEGA